MDRTKCKDFEAICGQCVKLRFFCPHSVVGGVLKTFKKDYAKIENFCRHSLVETKNEGGI